MQTRTANLDYLEQVLKVGFDHAARSFSKLLGARVRNGMSPGAYSMDYLPESIPENNDEEVYVLIIQVIGDFSGNSYLIFNKAESLVMIERLKPRSQDQHFQEAVLLEVDHIISAAVIAALANALGVEIYGDIPLLKKMRPAELIRSIRGDWETSESSKPVFAQTRLEVETSPHISPAFVWKLSSRILDKIPDAKLAS